MKNSTIIQIIILVLMLLPSALFCTPGVTPPPTPVPLDPVSGALLLGGGAYLGKKVYNKYKEKA